MKRPWWVLMNVVLVMIAPVAASIADETSPRPQAAAAAVASLKKQLGAALRGAMQEGGPMAAVDACRDQAPRITAATHAAGLRVGRTSHRLRNPDNLPESWMKPLLADYLAGPPEPGSYRVVDLGDAGTGYVEPIYLEPLCATCHGENIAPALRKQIREHYPEDRATGFAVGSFRGLFWAVVDEPEATSEPD